MGLSCESEANQMQHPVLLMSASKPLVALLDSLLLGQQASCGLLSPSVPKANARMVKVSEHPAGNTIKEVAIQGLESLQTQIL